jgi:hypothetical protein
MFKYRKREFENLTFWGVIVPWGGMYGGAQYKLPVMREIKEWWRKLWKKTM